MTAPNKGGRRHHGINMYGMTNGHAATAPEIVLDLEQQDVTQRRAVVKTLKVECWCMAAEVIVDQAEVRKGRTGSCGAPGCGP